MLHVVCDNENLIEVNSGPEEGKLRYHNATPINIESEDHPMAGKGRHM